MQGSVVDGEHQLTALDLPPAKFVRITVEVRGFSQNEQRDDTSYSDK